MSLPESVMTPKSKIIKNRTKKTCRIRRGFEQLSSYSGWRVITKKPKANLLARAVIKGLTHTDLEIATPKTTITNDDERGNPATTTTIQHEVM